MRLLNRNWDSTRARYRQKLVVWHIRTLRQLLYKIRPIPLNYWLLFRFAARSISGSPNPLYPGDKLVQSSGASLPIKELKDLLGTDELGMWTLDGDTITFLWRKISQDQPKVFIECGSGVSTLLLAKSLTHDGFGSTNSASVLSLEQDIHIKEATEKRLEACELNDRVRIVHTPTSKQGNYQVDTDMLGKHLGSEKVDWLVIDGPAGPKGCRGSTLPALAQFCRPGARWFLDDAFRDGELQVLSRWSQLRGIVVEGIYPVGKGLGTGIVTDPREVHEIS